MSQDKQDDRVICQGLRRQRLWSGFSQADVVRRLREQDPPWEISLKSIRNYERLRTGVPEHRMRALALAVRTSPEKLMK